MKFKYVKELNNCHKISNSDIIEIINGLVNIGYKKASLDFKYGYDESLETLISLNNNEGLIISKNIDDYFYVKHYQMNNVTNIPASSYYYICDQIETIIDYVNAHKINEFKFWNCDIKFNILKLLGTIFILPLIIFDLYFYKFSYYKNIKNLIKIISNDEFHYIKNTESYYTLEKNGIEYILFITNDIIILLDNSYSNHYIHLDNYGFINFIENRYIKKINNKLKKLMDNH